MALLKFAQEDLKANVRKNDVTIVWLLCQERRQKKCISEAVARIHIKNNIMSTYIYLK